VLPSRPGSLPWAGLAQGWLAGWQGVDLIYQAVRARAAAAPPRRATWSMEHGWDVGVLGMPMLAVSAAAASRGHAMVDETLLLQVNATQAGVVCGLVVSCPRPASHACGREGGMSQSNSPPGGWLKSPENTTEDESGMHVGGPP
jgi:hypothetical protein